MRDVRLCLHWVLGGKEYRVSRPHRLDFHGAIHIVHLEGRKGFCIYFDASVLARVGVERWNAAPHLKRFLQLLDQCCSECGVRLLGYCIQPNDGSMVLQTLGASLDACMQRLGGRYSRYLHLEQLLPKGVFPFAGRYESKVLAPEYLPHALRRVHARAVRAGLTRRAVDYPFSSAQAYLGGSSVARLETDAVWRALERKGLSGLRGYRDFMEREEAPYVTELFERGSPQDPRIVGGKLFVSRARAAAAHPTPAVTREQLIAAVAKVLGVQPEAVYSHSHEAVLARAIVAWHALRLGAASLREVGTWFEVSATTLGRGIRRYRRTSPDLFDNKSLPGVGTAESDFDD
jgi:putative transposase